MIYDHLEKYLGPIMQGWGTNVNDLGIEVSLFKEPFKPEIHTFSTLGLSKKILSIGSKEVRQEFIFSAYDTYSIEHISSFLMTFAESIALSRKGLMRGDFVEGKPLIKGASVTGIYASIPVLWPDEIQVFDESSPQTIIVWLIPITHKEAMFINKKGWNKFEDYLEGCDCDFWDLNRKSLM